MALDLGNILTTLGGQYINARYAQPPAVQAQPVDVFGFDPLSLLGSNDTVEVRPDGSICKKRKRRRRRRLATVSDIRDLAALKQVLGNGENFKTWIATRGR